MPDTVNVERREDYRPKPWERHVQTILTSLVLAAVVWLASTTNETAKALAVLQERVESLRAAGTNAITAAEARLLERRLQTLEERVERISNKD